MKILFDAREATRNITGIGTYVRNLAREIRSGGFGRAACRCVPEDLEPRVREGPRSRVEQLIHFARNVAWKQFYLPVRVRVEGADVLVCMDPIAPLVCPVPIGLIIYDLIFMTSGAQTDAWTRYWRLMVPRCARKAAVVFTLSLASKKEIVRRLGVPAERIVVFRTGVASHFRPLEAGPGQREQIRRRLGLPDSFVLTVGAHDPRRNVPNLLEAFRHLKQERNLTQKLVVVGPKTPFFERVQEITRRLGLEDDVLYVHYVPNEELFEYYGLADLYVYPSSEEGFGLTPLEAMACGCPVVTSRASSLPEVVGDAALLADPSDPGDLAVAMERVLSDRDLRQRLVQKGLDRARAFSWRAGAEDLVSACVSMVEGQRSAGREGPPQAASGH